MMSAALEGSKQEWDLTQVLTGALSWPWETDMGVWRESRAPGPRDYAGPGGRRWGRTCAALRDIEEELAKLLVDMERHCW